MARWTGYCFSQFRFYYSVLLQVDAMTLQEDANSTTKVLKKHDMSSKPNLFSIQRRSLPLMLLILILGGAVQAQFTYTTDNNEITITGYTGDGGVVAIPGTIDGLPVVTIGGAAFWSNSSLTSVTIPVGVTSIGNGAFFGCINLTSVTIPEGVTNIGAGAFWDCTSLTDIAIPSSVTVIGSSTFRNCTSLTSIVVDESNTEFSSVDGVLLNKSQTTLIQCPAGRSGSYSPPVGVTLITSHAFRHCSSLTSVTMPDSVSIIDLNAFESCTSLTSVVLPGDIFLAHQAFLMCTSLTSVYFNGNAPSVVGEKVFLDADDVIVYYLPDATGWEDTLADRPTAIWIPVIRTDDGMFGIVENLFQFTIDWASNQTVVVETCPDIGISQPQWMSLETIVLADGTATFSDPNWMNDSPRFYRVRSQ